MENKLTNEEIARVFAMYLDCKFLYLNGSYERTIEGVLTNESSHFKEWKVVVKEGVHQYRVDSVKLLLAPLSKIKDEHAIEVAKMQGLYVENDFIKNYVSRYEDRVIVHNVSGNESVVFHRMLQDGFQYLIQQGYAVPLFFGVNHPANGKTAIELGIAIEKK